MAGIFDSKTASKFCSSLEAVRNPGRRSHIDLDGLLFQCPAQGIGLRQIAVGQQHLGTTRGNHQGSRAVVIQACIAVALAIADVEAGLPLINDLLRKAKPILTRFQIHPGGRDLGSRRMPSW